MGVDRLGAARRLRPDLFAAGAQRQHLQNLALGGRKGAVAFGLRAGLRESFQHAGDAAGMCVAQAFQRCIPSAVFGLREVQTIRDAHGVREQIKNALADF